MDWSRWRILTKHGPQNKMANHFSILDLRTAWTVWKGKKIRHWKMNSWGQFSSVHSLSVANSLWPNGLQQASPPCPSPIPSVYPNSCPLSWWCHPVISSSVIPFSSCLQFLPAKGSFPMSQFFTSGRQNTGAWASTSVLPINTQDWFPLGWTGWNSLQSKGTPKSLLQHHSSKAKIL